MQIFQYIVYSCLCAIFLVACSTTPVTDAGFAVDGNNQQQETILPGTGTSKTVLTLLSTANQAARNGKLHAAESHLERALRIEPRNAVIWHYMAKLRLHQERTSEAEGLAARSNSLAGSNQRLKLDNWRIIAHARHQLGDVNGARQAQQKVENLTN